MAGSIVRIALSVLGAGVCYALWMVVGIPGARLGSSPGGIALFALAPLATASGFAVGMLLGERLTKVTSRGFLDAWISPLIACSVGAAAVYAFGPMLIVVAMFVLGTAAVAWRETRLRRCRTPAE